MTSRPLSRDMQRALTAMLKAPLRRGRDACLGDGWLTPDREYFALSVVRNLRDRGLVLQPDRMAALTIAGRQEAQRIQRAAA